VSKDLAAFFRSVMSCTPKRTTITAGKMAAREILRLRLGMTVWTVVKIFTGYNTSRMNSGPIESSNRCSGKRRGAQFRREHRIAAVFHQASFAIKALLRHRFNHELIQRNQNGSKLCFDAVC
jgi:hypothetical protein